MSKAVLIVDDSHIILDLFSFALSSAGYRVLTAFHGAEALDILAKNDISLVTIDINMPYMDGYTFARKIRSDEKFLNLPLIFVSTESEKIDMEKAYEAGANAYLVKPIMPDTLIAQVKLLIGDP